MTTLHHHPCAQDQLKPYPLSMVHNHASSPVEWWWNPKFDAESAAWKKTQWSRGSSLKVIPICSMYIKYIYLQNWAIYGVNVGKYLSTMEHMGIIPLPILDSPWIFGSVSTPIWNKLSCTKLFIHLVSPVKINCNSTPSVTPSVGNTGTTHILQT